MCNKEIVWSYIQWWSNRTWLSSIYFEANNPDDFIMLNLTKNVHTFAWHNSILYLKSYWTVPVNVYSKCIKYKHLYKMLYFNQKKQSFFSRFIKWGYSVCMFGYCSYMLYHSCIIHVAFLYINNKINRIKLF